MSCIFFIIRADLFQLMYLFFVLDRARSLPEGFSYEVSQPRIVNVEYPQDKHTADPQRNQIFIKSAISPFNSFKVQLKNRDSEKQPACHYQFTLKAQSIPLDLQAKYLFRKGDGQYITLNADGQMKIITITDNQKKIISQTNLSLQVQIAFYHQKAQTILIINKEGLHRYNLKKNVSIQQVQKGAIVAFYFSYQGLAFKLQDSKTYTYYDIERQSKHQLQSLQFKIHSNLTLNHYIQNYQVRRVYPADQKTTYAVIQGIQDQFVIQILDKSINKILRGCTQQLLIVENKVFLVCQDTILIYNRNLNKKIQDSFFHSIDIDNFRNLIPLRAQSLLYTFLGISEGRLAILLLNANQTGIRCQGLNMLYKIQFTQEITTSDSISFTNSYKKVSIQHTVNIQKKKFEYHISEVFLLLIIILIGLLVVRMLMLVQKKNRLLFEKISKGKQKAVQGGIVTQRQV